MDDKLEQPSKPEIISSRGKILSVEDDPALQRLIKVILNKANYEIETVGSLEAAKKYLEENKSRLPNLVISDHNLGEGQPNGEEVSATAKELGIPVLLVSSWAGNYDKITLEQRAKVGIVDALSKPFRPQELIDKVDSLLNPK